jgi:hypothetical protein
VTQANDSILVTPGSGATVATHSAASKEHQVVMVADDSGHIVGSKPTYFYLIPSQVHVNSANTVHWDLFNADASLLERTTAVGTGGSALTAWLADLSQTALDADITCRSKPTGGATASTDLRRYSLSSEETAAATLQIAAQGGLELVPEPLQPFGTTPGIGIVLRQNQGIRCVQETASIQGNTGWLIGFTVE